MRNGVPGGKPVGVIEANHADILWDGEADLLGGGHVPVQANSAIEAPAVPGFKFHDMTTIWLDGKPDSGIAHIINSRGGAGFF